MTAEEFLKRIDGHDPIFDVADIMDLDFTEAQALDFAERYASHILQEYKKELESDLTRRVEMHKKREALDAKNGSYSAANYHRVRAEAFEELQTKLKEE